VSVVAVFRVPAPSGTTFAPGSWDSTVGKSTPVRIADPRGHDGTSSSDTVCTEVAIADDGSYADLTLSVFVDDPERVLGLFVHSEMISIREGE
jgi:hypothetical protein